MKANELMIGDIVAMPVKLLCKQDDECKKNTFPKERARNYIDAYVPLKVIEILSATSFSCISAEGELRVCHIDSVMRLPSDNGRKCACYITGKCRPCTLSCMKSPNQIYQR